MKEDYNFAGLELDEWVYRYFDSDEENENDTCKISNGEVNEITSIQDDLAKWATNYNVSQSAVSGLLSILQKNGLDVPKDARTLLHSKRKIETSTVAGGEYFYFGLKYWLSKESQKLANISQLTLHANIDGIPLFNNSKTALWPILGCVVELNALIFPIALFCSNKKPTSIEEYLKDFVLEIKKLESAEFVNSETSYSYKIKLGAVICDTPAQAFVKCIKSHNSCNCCERCTQHGEYYHKIILPDMFTSHRTDSSFFQRSDPPHHVGISPLTELSFGMITGFPLDYMHLVCLGVVRQLINLWLHGPFTCKLSQTIISEISDIL